MSQQPPYPHDDAPTVTLRPAATHGPPPPLRARRSGTNTMAILSIVLLVAAVAATLSLIVLATPIAGSVPTDGPAVSEPAVPEPAELPAEEPVEPTGPVPTGPAGTAQVGVTDGAYGPEVPGDALAEQVGAQSGASDVVCPGYLPAQADASTVCSGTVDGQQAQLETRVTAVEGTEATVDITRVG